MVRIRANSAKAVNSLGAIGAYTRHFFILLRSRLRNFVKKLHSDGLDLTQLKLKRNAFFVFFFYSLEA